MLEYIVRDPRTGSDLDYNYNIIISKDLQLFFEFIGLFIKNKVRHNRRTLRSRKNLQLYILAAGNEQ